MKLQGMTIIYVLIVVPLLFIITMTLSFYANDLKVKISYDKKVRSAAQDAINAFEMNVSGENFSKVSDVLMPIVEASNNVFKDSLATQLGMSNAQKKIIEENNPMNLFTLYDGFYIESLTNQPVVQRDKNGNALYLDEEGVTKSSVSDDVELDLKKLDGTNKEENNYKPVVYKKKGSDNKSGTIKLSDAEFKKESFVKNLTPYSAFYKKDENSAMVNYTLDNFLRVSGKIGDVSFNKSGYLLNKDFNVESITVKDKAGTPIDSCFFEAIKNPEKGNDKLVDEVLDQIRLDGDKTIELKLRKVPIEKPAKINRSVSQNKDVKLDVPEILPELTIVYNPGMDYHRDNKNNLIQGYANVPKKEDEKAKAEAEAEHKRLTAYGSQQINSMKYYLKAAKFSNWVRSNLNWITAKNMQSSAISGKGIYEGADIFSKEIKNSYKDEPVFSADANSPNSYFNLHKKIVIKQAVYNELLFSLINYNRQKFGTVEGASKDKVKVLAGYQMPIIKDEDWDKMLRNVSFTTFIEGFRLGQGKYNNYITVSSSNNDMFINYNSMVFISQEAFKESDKYAETYEEGAKSYYMKGEAFIDSVLTGRVDPNKVKFIGFHENLFKNDGKYIASTGDVIFGHKNFEDPDVDFVSPKDLKGNIDFSNVVAKKAFQEYMLGLSSQKETQLKTVNTQDNYTVARVTPNKNILQKSPVELYKPSLGNIQGDKTIKSITLTYSFKNEGSVKNPNVIADVVFKFYDGKKVNSEYNFIAAQSKSDAVQVTTFENGFLEDRKNLGKGYSPFSIEDSKPTIKYSIREQNGVPIDNPDDYKLIIKEIKYYTY